MSPLTFTPAEPPKLDEAETKLRLREVISLVCELLDGEGSTTSSYYRGWCEKEATAKFCLVLLREGGLDSFLREWLPAARAELLRHFPEEEAEARRPGPPD